MLLDVAHEDVYIVVNSELILEVVTSVGDQEAVTRLN